MRQSEPLTTQANPVLGHDRLLHLPGTLQPHGVMLALSEPTLEIVQVSANTQAFFGIDPEDLLGQSIGVLFSESQIQAIQDGLTENLGHANPLSFSVLVRGSLVRGAGGEEPRTEALIGFVHRSGETVIVELERSPSPQSHALGLSYHHLARKAIAKLQKTHRLDEFWQQVVAEIQAITSFDRVHIYQFDHQGAGVVIAEAKRDDLNSYLGLHFPEFDIPAASRAIYLRCFLRCSPAISAPPVPLIPTEHPITAQPLDLSLAILRSVDPCCVKYYENMGSAAFLAIALIKDRQLWGLISCHHQTPLPLPYELRSACELIGQFAALELSKKVNHTELDNLVRFKSLHSEFIESIAQVESLSEALVNPGIRLLDVAGAQGAAVCLEDDITLVGSTPTLDEVQTLVNWTETQGSESLFHTDALPKLYPAAESFKHIACGLLLLRISKMRRYYILWFRPEVLQTVNWAGDPSQVMKRQADGQMQLSPRTSFALWQETVRLTSLPWKSYELTNALDLRNAIVGIVLKKADELAKINQELERSNRELDSFAFAASHDLKEPLRGIHNYSTILQEDYAPLLDEEGLDCLQTIVSLTQRMDTLIDVLLRFSQLGKAELNLQTTDLNTVVHQVSNLLRVSRPQLPFKMRMPHPLPIVECDPVFVNEVFSNLFSNALKYNDKPQPWIEVGCFDTAAQVEKGWLKSRPKQEVPMVFYVRDNGIGMRSHHIDLVFKLFKRLHAQEAYGGGAGAGLTIVRKIIERHGGRIWIESDYGKGSTFYFTLSPL